MQGLTAELIYGLWYVACPGRAVARGKTIGRFLMKLPLLIGRTKTGEVFAIRDNCPHRGIPLSHGNFDGEHIECCYHGWKFDKSGACVEIPSMREGQQIDLGKIQCGSYPCIEQNGLIWVFFAKDGETPAEAGYPLPPPIPDFEPQDAPQFHVMLPFECSTDHAAMGLMDPVHAPFVHRSWWFKRGAAKLRPKEKIFAPTELGWAMVRHQLPPQNIAYKILGKNPSTEIRYMLPGLRFENIRGEKHQATGLTVITPIDESRTEVHQFFWVSAGWMVAFKPLIQYLMKAFLDQDRVVVVRQREGLVHEPKLMLINDADTQARWWMRLKAAFIAAQQDGKVFENPLAPQTLRWMS